MTVNEIENLVFKYGDDLYRFCYHLTSNRDLADELYQETFLKAVQMSNKLDKNGNLKSYLMGIAINIWKNIVHKKARRNAILHEVDYEEEVGRISDTQKDILEDYAEKELLREMRKEIKKLPAKQKIVFVLYYGEEQSVEDISQMLHIPKGTVKSRLAKAREILRKEMEAKGYEI